MTRLLQVMAALLTIGIARHSAYPLLALAPFVAAILLEKGE